MHEKIHGIQDPYIPLPILEAAAYFYQKDLFAQKGWYSENLSNMDLLADHYGGCVREIGEDVHRLMFGNLDPERRLEALDALKARFSSDIIDEISGSNQRGPAAVITWQKVAKADLEIVS